MTVRALPTTGWSDVDDDVGARERRTIGGRPSRQGSLLSLSIGGCWHAGQRDVGWLSAPVVVSDENGTTPVACNEVHTHKVIAVAPRPEDCPSETDMFAQPDGVGSRPTDRRASRDAVESVRLFQMDIAAR